MRRILGLDKNFVHVTLEDTFLFYIKKSLLSVCKMASFQLFSVYV